MNSYSEGAGASLSEMNHHFRVDQVNARNLLRCLEDSRAATLRIHSVFGEERTKFVSAIMAVNNFAITSFLFPSLSMLIGAQQTGIGGNFMHTSEPIPWVFQLGQSYPNREETDQCRPIRLRITRNSRLYLTELVNNTNPNIQFQTADARLMTSRMEGRLNSLVDTLMAKYNSKLLVLQSWTDSSNVTSPNSLHFEG